LVPGGARETDLSLIRTSRMPCALLQEFFLVLNIDLIQTA
jgi:hypothetical protein